MDVRTHCNTLKVNEDGEDELKPKRVFKTIGRAEKAANLLNLELDRTEMVIPYQCTVCNKYHIGRNGKTLNMWRRKKIQAGMFDFKIVGKIDISMFKRKSIDQYKRKGKK